VSSYLFRTSKVVKVVRDKSRHPTGAGAAKILVLECGQTSRRPASMPVPKRIVCHCKVCVKKQRSVMEGL